MVQAGPQVRAIERLVYEHRARLLEAYHEFHR